MVRRILLGLLLAILLLGGAVVFLILRNNALRLEDYAETPSVSEPDKPSKAASAATDSPGTVVKWVKVSTNDKSAIYLDPAVSKRTGHNITIWLLRDYSGPQYDGSVNYLSSRDQIEVDCHNRRVRRIYSSNHPRSMGEGNFVSAELGPMSWNEVTRDSIIRRAVDIACLNSTG